MSPMEYITTDSPVLQQCPTMAYRKIPLRRGYEQALAVALTPGSRGLPGFRNAGMSTGLIRWMYGARHVLLRRKAGSARTYYNLLVSGGPVCWDGVTAAWTEAWGIADRAAQHSRP